MPHKNYFQHQQYPTAPAIEPVLKMLNVDDAAETDFSKLHTALKIGRVIVTHGTFMGNDPFGISETLNSVAESLPLLAGQLNRFAEASLEKTPLLTASMTGDVGNYVESYRERFQELVGDDPHVEFLSPTWTGQNHHLARADLAVRLVHQLLVRPLLPDQNVLLWGHSHAGNAFALLTNLLANHKPSVQQFFDAAAQDGVPHWDEVRHNLLFATSPHPLAKRISIASFETPVRYGWDNDGYARLVHVTFHRPFDDTAPTMAKPLFPPYSAADVASAKWGDWVQAFAIAGTDVSTMPTINQKLSAVLEANLPEPQHGLDTRFILPKKVRDTCVRWKTGTRCHADGLNLLVDYEPSGDLSAMGRPLELSLLGHGVATTIRWLPTHLKLIMEAMLP